MEAAESANIIIEETDREILFALGKLSMETTPELPPGKPAQQSSSRMKKRDSATRQKKDSYKGKGVNDLATF